jgi:hypothetical protein
VRIEGLDFRGFVGFRLQISGFRVGSRVKGLMLGLGAGFGVWGSGCRVEGLGFGEQAQKLGPIKGGRPQE